MTKAFLRQAALGGLLLCSAAAAQAKPTTINDITVDIPPGYEVSSSDRGLLAKTPDGEVDVWIETFKADENAVLLDEHMKYWKKEHVELNGEPDKTASESGGVKVHTSKFTHATWKGDPTVLNYLSIGPLGPQNTMVLVTYWASPGGDKEFGDQINKMIDTLHVAVPQ